MSGARGLAAIAVGVVLLVTASVAVVILAGNRPPAVYPAGSPEAALQAYLEAWERRDLDEAWASFSTAARSGTTQGAYRSQAEDYRQWAEPPTGPSRRVFIDRATLNGDRASLELTIEETWILGLSVSRSQYGQTLAMVQEDGAWRFDRLLVGLQADAFGM
jgi:hypothetical protein